MQLACFLISVHLRKSAAKFFLGVLGDELDYV
jgi:hypothetical protein